MHYLGVALIGMIQGVVVYFAGFFTKRVTVVAAAVAAWIALVAAFTVAVDAGITAVGGLAPPGIMQDMFTILPSNLPVCLGLLVATHLASVVYKMKSHLVSMFSLKATG